MLCHQSSKTPNNPHLRPIPPKQPSTNQYGTNQLPNCPNYTRNQSINQSINQFNPPPFPLQSLNRKQQDQQPCQYPRTITSTCDAKACRRLDGPVLLNTSSLAAGLSGRRKGRADAGRVCALAAAAAVLQQGNGVGFEGDVCALWISLPPPSRGALR
jgi:hypothetical protein